MNEFDDLFNVNQGEEPVSGELLSKEEWAKSKQQERETVYAMIEEMAGAVSKDGSKLQNVLNVMAQFDRYSVGNALLVAMQRPDSKRLAGAKVWQENGVYIRKGETGIRILEPGNEYVREDGTTGVSYNVKKVFDVSQTNSKEQTPTQILIDERLMLKALLTNAPCSVSINDEMRFPDNVSALYMPDYKAIYVKKGMDGPTAFRNLARELSLAALNKGDYSRADLIFKAIASSYILCRRNGVGTEDFSFSDLPKAFTELDAADIRKELGEIRNTANTISQNMNRLLDRHRDQKPLTEEAR